MYTASDVGICEAMVVRGYIVTQSNLPYYVAQQNYGSYELDSYEVNGVTFYYPVSGDRVGYDAFPAIPRKVDIEFRGDTLKQGFRSIE